MADFPVSIRDVDASWITETMRSAGELRNGAVTGFEIEPIGLGVGIMGLLYRLRLRYDAEGAGPASVVLKQPTDGPGARHVAEIFRFYEKEVGFYRDFAAHSPFVTPTCFMARHDSATDDFVLLLADVTDGQVHSQIDGCPPDAAHLAARALARHHAAFADSPRFAEPGNAWLPFASDSPTPEGVIQGVADARGPFREKFPEHATPELEALLDRYLESVHDLITDREGRPITLAHGDYRLDNLFFHPDGDLTVIDWQICAKTGFAYDLGYFMSQSLTVEARRAHEPAVISSYLEELERCGFHHDREDFIEDYRRTVMFCLCYPIQSGSVELVNDRARELVSDMFVRSMAAIEDHDATEFLVG